MSDPTPAPQRGMVPELGGVLQSVASMLELMSSEAGKLARHMNALGNAVEEAQQHATLDPSAAAAPAKPSTSPRAAASMPDEQDVLRDLFPGVARFEDQLEAFRAAGAASPSCAQLADFGEAFFAAIAEVVRHPRAVFPGEKRATPFSYAARIEARQDAQEVGDL